MEILTFILSLLLSTWIFYYIIRKNDKVYEEVDPMDLPPSIAFSLTGGRVLLSPDPNPFIVLHEEGHIINYHPEIQTFLISVTPFITWGGWMTYGWVGGVISILGWFVFITILRIGMEIQADHYAAMQGGRLNPEAILHDIRIVYGNKVAKHNTSHLAWFDGYPPLGIRHKLNKYWLKKYGYA